MNKRGLAQASGAVNEFLRGQELADALRPHLAKVHWAEVIGPQVSGVTQVEAVRDGILVVRVKNSVWANELTLLKEDMIRRLNARLGGRVLTDIRFKAAGLARSKKTAEPVQSPAPSDAELAKIMLSREAAARIEADLTNITDETLRGRIRRAMQRAARTEEWKRRQGWPICERCGALSEPLLVPNSAPLCTVCRAVVFGL